MAGRAFEMRDCFADFLELGEAGRTERFMGLGGSAPMQEVSF
jgi:hypothetical protein